MEKEQAITLLLNEGIVTLDTEEDLLHVVEYLRRNHYDKIDLLMISFKKLTLKIRRNYSIA